MPSSDPALICLTPVRNEAWILERFLRCARLWADHIVVVDHCSTDGSREIAREFPKVTLVEYDKTSFDEPERRRLLIETARSLEPDRRRILLALDADEAFTRWDTAPGWTDMLSAAPGTTITTQWANVLPGCSRCWLDKYVASGYVDDGRPFDTCAIHGDRVPSAPDGPRLNLEKVKLLHYQYADWDRMKSKQRWYQVWERIHHPQKRAVLLYRQYHQMDTVAPEDTRDIPCDWLTPYTEAGIDLSHVKHEPVYRWDREVVEMLLTHGPTPFRKVDIWNVDWTKMGRRFGYKTNGELADPRSSLDRAIHRWLQRTQRNCPCASSKKASK